LAPALEKLALGGVVGAGNRRVVRGGGFGGAAKPPQEIGANRVEQAIPVEIETLDNRERCGWHDLLSGTRVVED